MLIEYIQAAMSHATFEWDDEGKVFIGDILPCEGVLASGASEEECREHLREVLEGWLILRLRRNWEIPTIDGIALDVKDVA
jgi:predicted RNase H-like HicB family nuclease